MSRSTIFTEEPAKSISGNDKPMKSVRASHLVTFANFLTTDTDHSTDRPFQNTINLDRKKRIHNRDFHADSNVGIAGVLPKSSKKQHEMTVSYQKSSYDLIKFDSHTRFTNEKPEIYRRAEKITSSLKGIVHPPQMFQTRSTRKVNPKRFDSQNVKSIFTHQ